ncbi:MAG TPA: cytochrome c [bacterium]
MSPILIAVLAAAVISGVVVGLVIRALPRPRRRPLWMLLISLAALVLSLLVAAARQWERVRPPREFAEGLINPVAATPESIVRGEAIYRQNCQVCHGLSGGGNGPGAAGLNPPVSDFRVHLLAGHTDGRFFHWISEGIPGTAMPAFGDRLSEEERWDVINYMRHTFTPQEK